MSWRRTLTTVAWLGLAAGAAHASETLIEAGFTVALPPGYVRSAPEFEQLMQSQFVTRGGMFPDGELDASRGKVWAYEDAGAGTAAVRDRVFVVWLPGAPPPASDTGFRDGLREGFRASTAGPGFELLGLEGERLRDDVEGVTIRARMTAPIAARVRMVVVPRHGFVLMLYHVRTDDDVDRDDEAWRAVLAGITTTAGAPPQRSTSSAAGRAGRILAFVVVGGLVLFGIRAAFGRKPPPRDGVRRRRREANGRSDPRAPDRTAPDPAAPDATSPAPPPPTPPPLPPR